jgi:hypothetical protein
MMRLAEKGAAVPFPRSELSNPERDQRSVANWQAISIHGKIALQQAKCLN